MVNIGVKIGAFVVVLPKIFQMSMSQQKIYSNHNILLNLIIYLIIGPTR